MKKKAKKLLHWFFDKTDKGEENLNGYANLYELIEKLQWRVEDLENEHMQLLCEIAKLQSKIDILISDLPDEN